MEHKHEIVPRDFNEIVITFLRFELLGVKAFFAEMGKFLARKQSKFKISDLLQLMKITKKVTALASFDDSKAP
jgi:hypothetical protein